MNVLVAGEHMPQGRAIAATARLWGQPPPKPRVLVLGGGGFLGSAIMAALHEAGMPAVAAQRSACDHPHHLCDATDPAGLARLMEGADCVVNAVLAPPATMVAASHALAEAAIRHRVRRIVHISSAAVYGPATGRITESSPLRGRGSYARAKIRCEGILQSTGAVILRPALVHGPGGRQWTARIARLLLARRLGDLGPHGDGRCNLIDVRDVAAATLAALRQPQAAGHAIHLADPDPPSWNAFLVAFARALGAVPARRIPGWRLNLEAAIAPALSLSRLADPIPPSLIRLFAQDFSLDPLRADRLLGFARTPLPKSLAESAAWFISHRARPQT